MDRKNIVFRICACLGYKIKVYLPNSYVEYIATNGTRYSHITETFSSNNDTRDKIGNTRSGGEKRQTHDLRWYLDGVTGNIRPPYHQIRVSCYPHYRPNERHREVFLSCNSESPYTIIIKLKFKNLKLDGISQKR